jgi:hypothetical protein
MPLLMLFEVSTRLSGEGRPWYLTTAVLTLGCIWLDLLLVCLFNEGSWGTLLSFRKEVLDLKGPLC